MIEAGPIFLYILMDFGNLGILLSFLPNALSLYRILISPLLVWSLLCHHHSLTFLIIVSAALSDGLDGWIARRYHYQTVLGSLLDPVADKIFMGSFFIAIARSLPFSFLAIVLGREALLLLGAMVLKWKKKPLFVPHWTSKLNTFFQFVMAFTVDYSMIKIMIPLVTISTLLSLSIYIYKAYQCLKT